MLTRSRCRVGVVTFDTACMVLLPCLEPAGAMGKDEHMFSHMINIGRFWMFSLYYVVSELWGSVSEKAWMDKHGTPKGDGGTCPRERGRGRGRMPPKGGRGRGWRV